jgi:hypothetical protein
MVQRSQGRAVRRSLLLFLALQVGVIARDTDGVRQGLRAMACELEEQEALRLTQTLKNTLDPQARYWFRNVLGCRPDPVADRGPEDGALDTGPDADKALQSI